MNRLESTQVPARRRKRRFAMKKKGKKEAAKGPKKGGK
jgi:hypothetical protein